MNTNMRLLEFFKAEAAKKICMFTKKQEVVATGSAIINMNEIDEQGDINCGIHREATR